MYPCYRSLCSHPKSWQKESLLAVTEASHSLLQRESCPCTCTDNQLLVVEVEEGGLDWVGVVSEAVAVARA